MGSRSSILPTVAPLFLSGTDAALRAHGRSGRDTTRPSNPRKATVISATVRRRVVTQRTVSAVEPRDPRRGTADQSPAIRGKQPDGDHDVPPAPSRRGGGAARSGRERERSAGGASTAGEPRKWLSDRQRVPPGQRRKAQPERPCRASVSRDAARVPTAHLRRRDEPSQPCRRGLLPGAPTIRLRRAPRYQRRYDRVREIPPARRRAKGSSHRHPGDRSADPAVLVRAAIEHAVAGSTQVGDRPEPRRSEPSVARGGTAWVVWLRSRREAVCRPRPAKVTGPGNGAESDSVIHGAFGNRALGAKA